MTFHIYIHICIHIRIQQVRTKLKNNEINIVGKFLIFETKTSEFSISLHEVNER